MNLIFYIISIFLFLGCNNMLYSVNDEINELESIEEYISENNSELEQKSDKENNIGVVIFNNALIGTFYNGEIFDVNYETYDFSDEVYNMYSLKGKKINNKTFKHSITPHGKIIVDGDYVNNFDIRELVGISGDWDVMPKIPKEIMLPNKEIYDSVCEVLGDEFVQVNEPTIIQAYEIDLDNDMIDEQIIVAENLKQNWSYMQNNSYSLIFIRKIINGEYENIFLARDILNDDANEEEILSVFRRIRGILDIDGDGEIELLIESSSIDTTVYSIYDFKNTQIYLLAEYFLE